THACESNSELIAHYPRGASFLKKAFPHFAVKNTIAWFEERGVTLKVERDGRMFPTTDNSETIMRCLLDEAARYGVEIMLNSELENVEYKNHGSDSNQHNVFTLYLNRDRKIITNYVCLASGGILNHDKLKWLHQFGHTIDPTVPSLFTFNIKGSGVQELMGVSLETAAVKIIGTKHKLQGPILITHWGLSGPVVLKLSAWGALDLAALKYDFKISVNWIPEYNEQTALDVLRVVRFEKASQKMNGKNPFDLPTRLWEYLLAQSGVHSELRWADLPAKEQNLLAKTLCNQEFQVQGKTTFKEEFVTAGGVKLDQVNPATMESKLANGLFFAGEVLNIDGVTGGFNFQNAWTTGWLAAKAISEKEIQQEASSPSN
ncbi:MAG: hypothetical protein RL582_1517, partial [Bacteroidota bacterium]